MYNPQYEKPVNSATVSGENLESIFSMVNQLSQDLYAQLRNKETSDIEKGKPTTNSVEAFRYYVAGMTALENYRFVDAEDELLKAVKEDNTYALAFFKLSNIQYIIGKNQEAYKNFQNAGKYYDKLSETDKISYDIRRLNMEGHYAKMVDALREAINKYPSNIDFHLHYARILRGSGFLDNALEEFEYVLELDPGIKTVYNDLGYLYAARGDFSSAIKYINHYMKLQPDEANPYDSKGEILQMAGRLDEAIKAFQTALIKWPQFTHSALSLADIYREKGDERQSLAYIKAAENSVNGLSFLWDIQNAKFHTYWRFGRLDKARKVLYDIRKLDQFRASPLFLAEFFYNSIGDETEAENICKSTFQQYSDIINKENFHHTKSLRELAISEIFPADQAIPLLENVYPQIKTNLEKMNYSVTLALLHFRTGNIEKARSYNRRQDYKEVINALLLNRKTGWNNTWRRIFEILEYEPLYADPKEHFFYKLIEAGKKSTRKDIEVIGNLAKARLLERKNQLKASKIHMNYLGFPAEGKWSIIGPFNTDGISGFEYSFPVEDKNTIDTDNPVIFKGKAYRWTRANDHYSDGYINLDKSFPRQVWRTAYAAVNIKSDKRQKVQFRIGGDYAYKVWVNGDFVWQRYMNKEAQLDRDIITVVLHKGYNKVLLKIHNHWGAWGYYFRVTDYEGNGFKNITFHSFFNQEEHIAVKN